MRTKMGMVTDHNYLQNGNTMTERNGFTRIISKHDKMKLKTGPVNQLDEGSSTTTSIKSWT